MKYQMSCLLSSYYGALSIHEFDIDISYIISSANASRGSYIPQEHFGLLGDSLSFT
jgi:hypothetical protein